MTETRHLEYPLTPRARATRKSGGGSGGGPKLSST